MQDLALLHEDITGLPELPEAEWGRFKTLEFQELLRQRAVLSDRLVKLGCQLCEDFDEHVSVICSIGTFSTVVRTMLR
jgi:antiviral helicase SKI2